MRRQTSPVTRPSWSGFTAMSALQVRAHRVPTRSPRPVRRQFGLQPAPPCCLPERVVRQILASQGTQRDEPSRTGDVRNDEAMKIVDDRACDQLSEGTEVAVVRPVQRCEVAVPIPLEEDCRRIAEPDEQQVEQETSRPTVAVDEGVNALELAVQPRQLGRNVFGGDTGRPDSRTKRIDDSHPAMNFGRYISPWRRGHTAREGVNVMPAKGTRPLVGTGIRVRRHLPHLGHCQVDARDAPR